AVEHESLPGVCSEKLARPERFELPTPRFVVWCSIQLSYGRLVPVGPIARGGTARIAIGSPAPWQARPSGARPLAAPGAEFDRAIRDDEAEGGADGALDQAD